MIKEIRISTDYDSLNRDVCELLKRELPSSRRSVDYLFTIGNRCSLKIIFSFLSPYPLPVSEELLNATCRFSVKRRVLLFFHNISNSTIEKITSLFAEKGFNELFYYDR